MKMNVQVKLRGFRIELGEVEAAMADVPGVNSAAALVLEDASGNPQLVAYVTPDSAGQPSVSQPESAPSAALHTAAGHPAAVHAADAGRQGGPQGADDAARVSAGLAAAAAAEEYVAPRSDLEAAVQAAWQDVLGFERISMESDFFRIGGNSIMANKVTSRLRAALAVPLSGAALFQYPTVAEPGEAPGGRRRGPAGPGGAMARIVPAAGFDAASLAAGVPVSSQQEQLLRGEIDRLTYIELAMCERVAGALDVEAADGRVGGAGDAPRRAAHAVQGAGRAAAAGVPGSLRWARCISPIAVH